MKTERLITIVMMLLAQDTIAASRFATLFGVSKRTILRDMDSLSAAHIPVVAVRGSAGGFRLLEAYKFDKRLLSVSDLQHILTAVQGLDALVVADDVAATLTKISGMLPQAAHDPITLDFNGGENLTQTVEVLRAAIKASRLVAFAYYDRNGAASQRVVEPYWLLWRNTSWYLVGYSIERAAFRTFRLSRLSALTPGVPFTPRAAVPDGWQPQAPKTPPVVVRLRLSQANRGWLIEHFGAATITADTPAALAATVQLAQTPETFRFLAQCGVGLRVLAPKAFRQAYRDYLQQMVAANG